MKTEEVDEHTSWPWDMIPIKKLIITIKLTDLQYNQSEDTCKIKLYKSNTSAMSQFAA